MGMALGKALEFVSGRNRGVLVTIRRNGRPQLSNIMYTTGSDGLVRVSLTDTRAKTNNLRRDPRASLYVTRDDFFAYVVLEGEVHLTDVASDPGDPVVEELVDVYRAIGGEHPDWDEYRQAMVADRRLVARLHPTYAYGMGGS